MSAEFASTIDDNETSVGKKSGKKRKESIIRVADKAIEKEAERPKYIFYSLESDKSRPPEKPPVPLNEMLKAKNNEQAETEAVDMEADLDPEIEQPAAVQQLAEFRLAELESQPLPEPDAERAAELEARDFLARAAESGNIEGSAAAVRAEVGISDQEMAAARHQERNESPESEPPVFEGPREFEDTEINLRQAQDTVAEELEPEEEPPAAGGGSAGTPPRGPAGRFGPPGNPAGHNMYTVPYGVAAGTTQERQGHIPEYDQGNPAVTALVGGIIGYIIGKRRGRRLEQRKLLPVQKKLEKQVTDLNWQLRAKEGEIRRVAARKVQIEGVEFMNRLDKAVEKSAARAERRQLRQMEQATAPRRQRAPEAHHLHGSLKSHERIGHMLMAAEAAAPVTKHPEAGRAEKDERRKTAEAIGDRRVETLNRAELLQLSERVMVDGTSLRQIYESKLIGERGLRRLMAEHLRGGDIKKVLRQEIIEREIDFERDPVLRDQPLHGAAAHGTGGAKPNPTQLNQLLAKAGASLSDGGEEAAFYKARAAYEVSEKEQQRKQKQMMDMAFVSIILILIGLIVWLAISRG